MLASNKPSAQLNPTSGVTKYVYTTQPSRIWLSTYNYSFSGTPPVEVKVEGVPVTAQAPQKSRTQSGGIQTSDGTLYVSKWVTLRVFNTSFY